MILLKTISSSRMHPTSAYHILLPSPCTMLKSFPAWPQHHTDPLLQISFVSLDASELADDQNCSPLE